MKRNTKKERLVRNKLNDNNISIGDVYYFDRVTSTMSIAEELDYDTLRDATIVITDEQTHGRGRYLRKWYGSDKDCMFSIVLKQYDFTIPYSMIASLAVYDVLSPLSKNIRLKWVNDVLWGSKKVSGILTEEKENRTVIGVGVNINSGNFPSSISGKATSLFIETRVIYDKIEYLVKFIGSIISYIDEAHNGATEKILKKWEKASGMLGKKVKVESSNGEQSGIVYGIDYKTGALKLMKGEKTVELYDGTLYFL